VARQHFAAGKPTSMITFLGWHILFDQRSLFDIACWRISRWQYGSAIPKHFVSRDEKR
jgi:hypothetical protein